MKTSRSWPVSLVFLLGLLWLYAGQRIAEAGPTQLTNTLIGLALVVGSTAWRFARTRTATGERAQVEKALFGLQLIGLAAVAMYFAQSDAFAKIDGQSLEHDSPKLAGALAALWPAVVCASLLPMLLVELGYGAMARAPKLELGRIREAMYSGLGLAGALVFALSLQYVVSERDAKADFSYFRTAKPGDATRKLVQSIDEPMKVTLFFPPANDVAEAVVSYFDELKKESTKVEVELLDHALEPGKAKELAVSGNGTVVISKGSRKEQLFIGQELEKARTQLRSLDQDVQKKLLLVAKSKRTIYLTTGHGERTEEPLGTTDQRATISALKGELKAQNYDLKVLSVAEGLGSEIPKDAAAVMVLGPMQEFSPDEAKSLEDYGKKGGKLFIALDPETGLDFKNLLDPLGLKFVPVVLANDTAHGKKTYTLADRTIIGTNSYSSHPTVSTNGRAGNPMFLMGAGEVAELPTHPAELSIDFAVRAMPQTWNDLNNNYNADTPPEVRKAYGLVAAVTSRAKSGKIEDELRAVVLGDSDAIGDEVLQVARGNAQLVLDGFKWLLGDEKLMGATNTENDVPITRTRTQDSLWFYGTIFLAPALVILAGYLARRRAFHMPGRKEAA